MLTKQGYNKIKQSGRRREKATKCDDKMPGEQDETSESKDEKEAPPHPAFFKTGVLKSTAGVDDSGSSETGGCLWAGLGWL